MNVYHICTGKETYSHRRSLVNPFFSFSLSKKREDVNTNYLCCKLGSICWSMHLFTLYYSIFPCTCANFCTANVFLIDVQFRIQFDDAYHYNKKYFCISVLYVKEWGICVLRAWLGIRWISDLRKNIKKSMISEKNFDIVFFCDKLFRAPSSFLFQGPLTLRNGICCIFWKSFGQIIQNDPDNLHHFEHKVSIVYKVCKVIVPPLSGKRQRGHWRKLVRTLINQWMYLNFQNGLHVFCGFMLVVFASACIYLVPKFGDYFTMTHVNKCK